MKYPRVLLLSSTLDFSTDHIAWTLKQMDVPFARLNRDQFADMEVTLYPDVPKLVARSTSLSIELNERHLKSIYFRAPTFLRDNYQPDLTPDDQFSRSQWSAFLRAMIVFESAFWVNHPTKTYQAEVKPYQLKLAKSLGLQIPQTTVTNSPGASNIPESRENKLAVKTLDSTVLRFEKNEGFIYTNIVEADDIRDANFASAPSLIQEALTPKVDIRATVVGNRLFAAEIRSPSGEGIEGDWRLRKGSVNYVPVELPKSVEERCIELVVRLGLAFAGIDLIRHGEQYVFIEINPTGEWAWLMPQTQFKIDHEISQMLAMGE